MRKFLSSLQKDENLERFLWSELRLTTDAAVLSKTVNQGLQSLTSEECDTLVISIVESLNSDGIRVVVSDFLSLKTEEPSFDDFANSLYFFVSLYSPQNSKKSSWDLFLESLDPGEIAEIMDWMLYGWSADSSFGTGETQPEFLRALRNLIDLYQSIDAKSVRFVSDIMAAQKTE